MSKRYELAKKYNEKYKSSLKHCSYCGCKDINITTDRYNSKNVWSVNCSNCGDCIAFKTSIKEAIRLWNERNVKESMKLWNK